VLGDFGAQVKDMIKSNNNTTWEISKMIQISGSKSTEVLIELGTANLEKLFMGVASKFIEKFSTRCTAEDELARERVLQAPPVNV
jgi:hypothetical protein